MARPKFADSDFFTAARSIAAERGPSAVTVGSIGERLSAPVGSFYHRFASRDVLLGELWLQTVNDFQRGIAAALDAGDGLRAALHTPSWVRQHPEEARLLLLYHRDDFVQGEWPSTLRERVAAHTAQSRTGTERFAQWVLGHTGTEEIRYSQFLLAELPVSVVRQHLRRREPPPPLVDALIRITFEAVVGSYRSRRR
jgi:AcrR family transcriptional regulator